MSHGILEEVSSSPKIIEWTISDFFELPEEADHTIYSSEFNFLQYACKLSAIQKLYFADYPELLVVDLHGIGKDGIIRWELEVRRSNGVLFKRCRGLKEDGEEMVMNIYLPLKGLRPGIEADGILKVRCMLCCDDAIHEEEVQDENNKVTQTAELIGYAKLSCDFERMMLHDDYYDVTIKVQDKEFRAHKSVLGVRVALLAHTYREKMAENDAVIELEDCDPIAFQEFLRYLYTGRIANYNPYVVCKIAQICQKHRVPELVTFCIETIVEFLNVDIFCGAVKMALQSKPCVKEKLVVLCVKFLSENMREIENSEKWKKFEIDHPDAAEKLMERALFVIQQQKPTWKDNIYQMFFRRNKSNMRR